MTAYAAVPNLYQEYNLSPGDSCQELGILLAGKDARAEAGGLGPESGERKRLGTVYSVLSSPENRRRYDATLKSEETVTWRQLEYLGNFGNWPPAEVSYYAERGRQQQHEQQRGQQGQFGQRQGQTPRPNAQQASPYAQPLNPFQVNYAARAANTTPMHPAQMQPGQMQPGQAHSQADIDAASEMVQRPSAGARIGMTLVDWMLGSLLASFPFVQAVNTFTGPVWDYVGPSSTFFIVLAAYYIVCEVLLGATPGKLIAGYEVRDRKSKEKLTVTQSLKRNWFRVATLIPYIGVPISVIGAVVTFMTINPKNQLTGSHDDLANAEVAKRRRR